MRGRDCRLRVRGNRLPLYAAGIEIITCIFNAGRHRMVMPDIAGDICLFGRLFIRHTNVGVRNPMVVMGRVVRMFMRTIQLMRPRRDVYAAEQDSERQK